MRAYSIYLIVLLIFSGEALWGQKALVSETLETLKTYSFSDPDPIPVMVKNPKIYPYHRYEGYSDEPIDREWKVVKLENEYLEVFILPEIGGKVWGAREKKSGKEFIYRNEVVKFRNISMRGPWTSGGIEFNFGIIGHHASTATPVDYDTKTNEDGSVSCFVGNIDLPSRTQWRVEIRLPADRAYFETRVVFYNTDPLPQAYYNWMTAAAFAQEDLVFYCPGDQYLEHGGNSHSWPLHEENGKDLSRYAENKFGPSKSYHVVGVDDDFFGGYYEDEQYGFGHWSPYEEMPGQKLWLWALSRSGGIWEDLLTDTDGQYIEFQAGRMFDQYSLGPDANPITKSEFEPGRTDIWREFWFPVPDIGGLTEVSKGGMMHIRPEEDQVEISSFGSIAGSVIVSTVDGDTLYQKRHNFEPLVPVEIPLAGVNKDGVVVHIPVLDLRYDPTLSKDLDRPFEMDADLQGALANSIDRSFRNAEQQFRDRNYDLSKEGFVGVLKNDPAHLGAHLGLAKVYFKEAQFDQALATVKKALQLDTYHPEANYVAAIIYKALQDTRNAIEAYGWASRSLQFRAESYAQIAILNFRSGRTNEARRYANNALDFNRFHMGARELLVLINEKDENSRNQARNISAIRTIDPLNHFGHYETYKLTESPSDLQRFGEGHRSELPHQTYLELAIKYHDYGAMTRAIEVLELAPEHPLVDLWHAWLIRKERPKEAGVLLGRLESSQADFVFPYRLETLEPLKWAETQSDSWKLDYYAALQLWGLGQTDKALEKMERLGATPELATFYMSRAALYGKADRVKAENDLRHALKLAPNDWRTHVELLQIIDEVSPEQLELAQKAFARFPQNDAVLIEYASILLQHDMPAKAISIMESAQILPFEGASIGRNLWESAHLKQAIRLGREAKWDQAEQSIAKGRTWPENLGVGRPFNPDERRLDFMELVVQQQTGLDTRNQAKKVVDRTLTHKSKALSDGILGLYCTYLLDDQEKGQQVFYQLGLPIPLGMQMQALGQQSELDMSALIRMFEEAELDIDQTVVDMLKLVVP